VSSLVVHVAHQDVLPERYGPSNLTRTLNAGLLHQRYAGLPLHPSSDDPRNLIEEFVLAFDQQAKEGNARLAEIHDRLARHVLPSAETIGVDIELSARLAIGLGSPHPLENGLTFHHTLGVPYLPGTSLKGVLRAWVRLADEALADELFGRPAEDDFGDRPGRIQVLDALPLRWPKLSADLVNCHLPAYYSGQPGDGWPNPGAVPREAPRPAMFIAVEAGTPYRFRLEAADGELDLEVAMAVLREALALFGVGAKTAAGYGAIGTFDADDYTNPTRILGEPEPMQASDAQVFLSHSSVDKERVVIRLANALTRRGVTPWLDQEIGRAHV